MADVFMRGERVGTLDGGPDGRLSFRYAERALDEPASWALSVRLPVRREPYGHRAAAAFFENLLPEAESRGELARAAGLERADVVGLLGAVGGECAGAVSIWPPGEAPPEKPRYRAVRAEAVGAAYDGGFASWAAAAQLAAGQSLSGSQRKLALRRRGDALFLPLSGSPSTFIIKRPDPRYPALALNEFVCLRLMAAAGVPTAETAVRDFDGAPTLESVRYDRIERGDGTVVRLHQEDLCQATGRPPARKYGSRGGPDFAEIAALLRRRCVDPLRDLMVLVRWTMLNLLVGNDDAHAKNLALSYAPDGLRLAPIYDVVSTGVYRPDERELGLEIGGARTVDELTPEALAAFAEALGMKPRALPRLAAPAIEAAAAAAPDVLDDVVRRFGHPPVLDAVAEVVAARRTRLLELFAPLDR